MDQDQDMAVSTEAGQSENNPSTVTQKVASGVVKIAGSTVEEFTQVSYIKKHPRMNNYNEFGLNACSKDLG